MAYYKLHVSGELTSNAAVERLFVMLVPVVSGELRNNAAVKTLFVMLVSIAQHNAG